MGKKDSFIDRIIRWLEGNLALPEIEAQQVLENPPDKKIPEPIVKEVIKETYEDELKDFPDFNEKEFFVEVQDILWQQIRSLSDTQSIRFFSLEVGIIIECPKCHVPAEIKVEARDTQGNRFFLIKCLAEDTLWVDDDFINSALEQRIIDLMSLRKYE